MWTIVDQSQQDNNGTLLTRHSVDKGEALLTLDVIAKHLPVALSTSLSKSLSSLAAARHGCKSCSESCQVSVSHG